LELLKLTLADLVEISQLTHGTLAELDKTVQQNFRVPLPNTSFTARLSTAALLAAGAVSMFMVVLAAYVRSAVLSEAITVRGTIFHTMLASLGYRITALLVVLAPTAALGYLWWSVGWLNGWIVGVCTVVSTWATIVIGRRITSAFRARAAA
jgi:hypothetical protein